MEQTLSTRLEVNTSASEYSRAVDIGPDNAAFVDVVVYHITGTAPELSVQLQGSNDGQNWENLGTGPVTADAEGHFDGSGQVPNPNPVTDIAFSALRLKYSVSGPLAQAIVGASINTYSE